MQSETQDMERLAEEEQSSLEQAESSRKHECSTLLSSLLTSSTTKHHLYGREEEQAQLLQAYELCTTKRKLVLVEGPSGSGKTSLVTSTLGNRACCFVSGKFQESQPPYGVFVEALTEYANHVYDTAPHMIPELQESIHTMVGEEGITLLTEWIPGLVKIVGQHCGSTSQSKSQLSAQAALQRFKFLFGALIQGICHVHPLTLFLDDLQWANAASLELVQTLLSLKSDNKALPLCVVGAHRPMERDSPLSALVRDHDDFEEIYLCDWNMDLIHDFLCDVLQQEEPDRSLSQFVHAQTQGNVLHVLQFVRLLVEQDLLRFNGEIWELRDELLLESSQSLTELLLHKMQLLSSDVQDVLKVAACMGSVDDSAIALVLQETNIAGALQQAADAGLLVFFHQMGEYAFAHDRIRQAALMLLEEPDQYCLYVGRQLWNHVNEENIFVIVALLNRGKMSMDDTQERYRLAALNLEAGEKAASLSSFPDAAFYLNNGIDVLGRNHWTEEYELTLSLYDAAAEAEMCNANFERVKDLIGQVLEHARVAQDKMRSYVTLMSSVGQQDDVEEALTIGFHAMQELGHALPKRASKVAIVRNVLWTKWMMRGMTTQDVLSMPQMKDENLVWCSEILNELLKSAVMSQSPFIPIIVLRSIQLCIRHGLYRRSSLCFAYYAYMLNVHEEGSAEGLRMAQIALALLEASGAHEVLPRVYGTVYSGVHHWQNPLRETLEPLRFASRVGLEMGDVEMSMLCGHRVCFHSYYTGLPLGPLEELFTNYARQMKAYKQENALISFNLLGQLIHNLTGRADDPSVLKGDIMDIDATLKEAHETHNTIHAIVCLQMSEYVAYLFGAYTKAGAFAEELRNLKGIMSSYWGKVEACFIGGLTATALARIRKSDAKQNLRIGKAKHKEMARWAEHCPSNFLHKQKLMEAELAGLDATADSTFVVALYDQAIEAASAQGVVHEEALACERASEYVERMKDVRRAAAYRSRARSLYLKFGATAKAATIKMDSLANPAA